MRVPKAKDSNYPIKDACLGFCTLKGQTPLPVSMIISTTCPTPVVWVGKQLVYLLKPQMSSYYGFFLLYQASFCKMAGRCVCSLAMTKMFLCEMGWNGFSHRVFGTVETILFCVFFFFKRLAFSMSELSPQHRSLCTRPHVFVFADPGCIQTHSLCAGHFCVCSCACGRAEGI